MRLRCIKQDAFHNWPFKERIALEMRIARETSDRQTQEHKTDKARTDREMKMLQEKVSYWYRSWKVYEEQYGKHLALVEPCFPTC